MLSYKVKTKNDAQTVLIDIKVYEHINSLKAMQEMDFWNNLRLHSSNGTIVFQKWWGKGQDGKGKVETIYLHKWIAEQFIDKPDNENAYYATFKNGDKYDCRLENLVWYTRSELNRMANYQNETGYKCVRKEGNRYRATVFVNNKLLTIGTFDTAEQAAIAYNEKAHELLADKVKRINKIKPTTNKLNQKQP